MFVGRLLRSLLTCGSTTAGPAVGSGCRASWTVRVDPPARRAVWLKPERAAQRNGELIQLRLTLRCAGAGRVEYAVTQMVVDQAEGDLL